MELKNKLIVTLSYHNTDITQVIRRKNEWLNEFGFFVTGQENPNLYYEYKVRCNNVGSSIELRIFENATETTETIN